MTTQSPSASAQWLAHQASENPKGIAGRIKNDQFRTIVAADMDKALPPNASDQTRADFLLFYEFENAEKFTPIKVRPIDLDKASNFDRWRYSNGELDKPAPKEPREGLVKHTGPGNTPPYVNPIREGLLKKGGPQSK